VGRAAFSKDWSTIAVESPSGTVLDIVVLPGFWHLRPELRTMPFGIGSPAKEL